MNSKLRSKYGSPANVSEGNYNNSTASNKAGKVPGGVKKGPMTKGSTAKSMATVNGGNGKMYTCRYPKGR